MLYYSPKFCTPVIVEDDIEDTACECEFKSYVVYPVGRGAKDMLFGTVRADWFDD